MKFDRGRLYRWAKAVKAENGDRCVRCGSKKDTEVHHIEPKHKFPKKAYLLSNGVVLCKGCHRTKSNSYHTVMGHKGNLRLFKKWLRLTSNKTLQIQINKKDKPSMLRFIFSVTIPIHLIITVVGFIVMGKLSNHHIIESSDYVEVWSAIWHNILMYLKYCIEWLDKFIS